MTAANLKADRQASTNLTRSIYFLPGRGARLDGRLGSELTARGYSVTGRSLHHGFDQLRFSLQVQQVQRDIKEGHWGATSIVVAHSYGAHLALSALCDLEPFPGTLALISPVFRSVREGFNYFRVPNAKYLANKVDSDQFPKPQGDAGIVSGTSDWQVPVEGLERLASCLGAEIFWVDQGHDLGPEPVQVLLDSLGIKQAVTFSSG